MTSPDTLTATIAGLAAELREHLKLKYIGDCKCGQCQLVPFDLVSRTALALEALTNRGADKEAEPGGLPIFVPGSPVRAPGDRRIGRIATGAAISVPSDGEVFVDYPAGGGKFWHVSELQSAEEYRDRLGRAVRHAWVLWAKRQPNPKATWLVPYDQLSEPDKEADRQIGEAIALYASPPTSKAEPVRVRELPIDKEELLGLLEFTAAQLNIDLDGPCDAMEDGLCGNVACNNCGCIIDKMRRLDGNPSALQQPDEGTTR